MANDLSVVDLFCGAGGLSLGFAEAGFQSLLAVDNTPTAVETYQANLGGRALCASIDESSELPPTAVLIGGPPCQGFSSAGLRRPGDPRNSLVAVFAALVARVRPRAFVFENVEGFLTSDNGARVLDLLVPLIEAGYRIHLRKVNAANYGVPQHRKRVLAIGGLGWDPSFPAFSHSAQGAPGAHLAGGHLPPAPPIATAIADLPPASAGPPGDPPDHYSRPLEGIELQRVMHLGPGATMRDLPRELWHGSYQRRAYRRVMDGMPTERRGGAPFGIRRLRLDQPSKAVTGGARSEFVHPIDQRFLTLRECARIQSFPDSFLFYGTASERMTLIGNAVPALLAKAIAESLARDLSLLRSAEQGGSLISFVPTLSSGMSPALEGVSRLIARSVPTVSSQLELLA